MSNISAPTVRRNDREWAWALYALQLLGELVLAPFWMMSVMMIDSCGSVADEPRVCNAAYFASGFFGFAAVLVLAAVAVPIAIVVAGHRGGRRWVWPAGAIVGLGLAAVGYVWLMTR
jgi:hypothetical protein